MVTRSRTPSHLVNIIDIFLYDHVLVDWLVYNFGSVIFFNSPIEKRTQVKRALTPAILDRFEGGKECGEELEVIISKSMDIPSKLQGDKLLLRDLDKLILTS